MPAPHTTQIKICKIHFYHPCNQCNILWSFLRPDGTNLSNRRVRMLETYIIKKISIDNFIFWYNGVPQNIKNMVECGQGYHSKYQWWNGSCSAVCYYTTSENGNMYSHLMRIQCTELYCCGMELRYCYNSTTQQVERTEVRLQYPLIDCTQYDLPITVCPDGLDKEITECEDSCEDDN